MAIFFDDDTDDIIRQLQDERDAHHLYRTLTMMIKRMDELEANSPQYVHSFVCEENELSSTLEVPVDGRYILSWALKSIIDSDVTINVTLDNGLIYTQFIDIESHQEGDTLTDVFFKGPLLTSSIISIEVVSPDDISAMNLCVNMVYQP